jgi:hypothetical protein
MVRLLILLLGTLTASRPGQQRASGRRADDSDGSEGPGTLLTDPIRAAGGGGAGPPGLAPSWPPQVSGRTDSETPRGTQRAARPPRRRISPQVKWAAVMVAAGLIFRKAIASMALLALSSALHLAGVNVHLPSVRFAWPWQANSAGTTNTGLGPWVLQKIEGISKPALGRANFNFLFTHRVSKDIGPLPCWYASTFYAVGHASASVDLNPGPAWWTAASGHYRLEIVSHPREGRPGHVTVTMVLPQPQLPQSAHDIAIDDIPSRPISTQHSWTYPGLACGVLLRPQFPESVLYSQAQQIAFYRSSHVPQVTGPLMRTAETEAVQIIRNNFIQPTVNAFGYTLDRFTMRWATAP